MAKFKCLSPPKTVTFQHGRGDPVTMEFPTANAKTVECVHCILALESLPNTYERVE